MPTIVRQTVAGWSGRRFSLREAEPPSDRILSGKNCAASRSLMMTVSAPGAPSLS